MMNTLIKMSVVSVLFLIMTLLPVTSVLAVQSDAQIQQRIMAQISESALLQGIHIDIHVEQRLVVFTGNIRIYEQKLVIERIAWTALGVFEVDNELSIVPLTP